MWDTPFAICQYNFNPRSPCGERPYSEVYVAATKKISIHAPHAGSDIQTRGSLLYTLLLFQSTLPMRGATAGFLNSLPVVIDISIHAPHAGSDDDLVIKSV